MKKLFISILVLLPALTMQAQNVLTPQQQLEKVQKELEVVKKALEAEKMKAEAEKMKAEAEKVKAEAEKVKADQQDQCPANPISFRLGHPYCRAKEN